MKLKEIQRKKYLKVATYEFVIDKKNLEMIGESSKVGSNKVEPCCGR